MNSFLCLLLVTPILLCHLSPAITQVLAEQCDTIISYENRDQLDPKPLNVKEVIGRVMLEGGNPVVNLGPASGACLGVFTEKGHKLVATATTDQSGRFKFSNIASGEYRLIVRYETFCVANVPIRIAGKAKTTNKDKQLILHMRPAAIDECSYGEIR